MKRARVLQSPKDPELSLQDQKGIIINILNDVIEDADTLISYLGHIGFDLRALSDARDLEAGLLGHYRIKMGQYDVDRACNDLATWPPIAARIAELRLEKSGS